MAKQEKINACVDEICHERKTMHVSSIWVFLGESKRKHRILSMAYVVLDRKYSPKHVHRTSLHGHVRPAMPTVILMAHVYSGKFSKIGQSLPEVNIRCASTRRVLVEVSGSAAAEHWDAIRRRRVHRQRPIDAYVGRRVLQLYFSTHLISASS